MCLSKPPENIVGKGENAGNQHFLLFPQCFQETFFPSGIKGRHRLIKGEACLFLLNECIRHISVFLFYIFPAKLAETKRCRAEARESGV